MLKKVLKWIAIVLGALIGLLLVVGLVMMLAANYRLNKTYDFPASDLPQVTDPAKLALAAHQVETVCAGCHGSDLSGMENWFNVPAIGRIDSANLTTGEGGVGREYTSDEDYVRAVRHGIDPEGKPIYMVAVPATSRLSDEDLAAIIAYIRALPPVDHVTAEKQFTPIGKIMMAAGMFGQLPVESVSHETHVSGPPPGATAAYGEYLVNINDCRTCHGPDLNGARFPDPSIQKISPNLTTGGEVAFWTEQQFIDTIRTGVTPGGHEMDPKLMPWKEYSVLYDDELKAIYLYLQTLPKLEQYTE